MKSDIFYKSYLEYKRAFIQKHQNADWRVDTSSMDETGKYSKTYLFSDGAVLYEVNRPVWRKVQYKGMVNGQVVRTIETEEKLFETEAWNSDNADSVFFYEMY